MNILILSTSHPYKIAGIVALDLFKGLKNRDGNKVRLVVKNWDRFNDKNIVSIENYFVYLTSRVYRKIEKILIKLKIVTQKKINTNPDFHVQDYNQTKTFYSTEKILRFANITPDVIIIVFAQGFLTSRNIFELNKITGVPIYWQLADMAPFTGLCHYSWNCEGYKKLCGNCPAIFSCDPFDVSNTNLKFKLDYFRETKLRILIGSNWLLDRAKESLVFKDKPISKIFISVNENEFHPYMNSQILRDKNKIPPNTFVIGFGANGLTDKRKGIIHILEAINLIETDKNLLFIYAGNERIYRTFNHPTKYIGLLERNQLPDFYRLCDLFLSASLQDTGPYMIVEALMCGIPVVSFNTGIASDFVITDITGVLVENLSTEDLANGVIKMLNKGEVEILEIKRNCFNNSKEKLALPRQINEYYKLFKLDKILD